MILGLDHVQIASPPGGEAAARRFYGDLLGLSEVAKPEALRSRGGVWFNAGAQQLHVGIEEPFRPARKAHPALRASTDRIDEVAERLRAAGVPVDWDEQLPGVWRFYAEDPWGNRVEVLAYED